MGPYYGPVAALKRSEARVPVGPVLNVVCFKFSQLKTTSEIGAHATGRWDLLWICGSTTARASLSFLDPDVASYGQHFW